MRRVVLVLAIGVAALGAASTAAAQTAPPTLTGEVINAFVQETSGFGTVTFTCPGGGPDGSGTFTVEGQPDIPGTSGGGAIGPYPGTATESGSLTMSGGWVTAFSAGFQIFSGTTTITGTKLLQPPAFPAGVCGPFVLMEFFQVSGPLRYEATIDTGSGTFTDSGVTLIVLSCFVGGVPNTDTCTMQESFESEQLTTEPADECSDRIDNDGDLLIDFPADPGCESAADDSESNPGTPPQCEDDDDDRDGLRANADSLFGGLLGNRSSDAGGARDGNDDDDGEDDECEDDDDGDDEDDDEDDEDDDDEDD